MRVYREYDYVDVGHGFPIPAVNITVTGPSGEKIGIWGHLDSGASCTVFPDSLMGRLGVPIEQCATYTADTPDGVVSTRHTWVGKVTVYDGMVQLDIAEPRFRPSHRDEEYVLLGRDYFACFQSVEFSEKRQVVRLEV
jgi:hypothetical protein